MSVPLDMDVTLGDIIKIVLIAGGWIVTIVKIDGRLKSVEKDIKEVTTLVKWRERLEERVMNIRRDVDDLRRRRGFIQGEVDGEYEGTGHSKT